MSLHRLSWVGLFLAAAACEGSAAQPSLIAGESANAAACTPGQQAECACAGGSKGFQVCAANGSRYDACECSGANGGVDGGSSESGTEDIDAGGLPPQGDAGPHDASLHDSSAADSGSSPTDSSTSPDACSPTFEAALSVGPKYVLFVLDGSGSMQGAKWSSAKAALTATFNALETAASTTLAVGLVGFSDSLDATFGTGPYPTLADVELSQVTAGQATRLRARLASDPEGATPTKKVLEGAHAALASYAPASPIPAGGRRAIVFMTDGNPNGGATEETEVVALVSGRRLTSGTQTFAIGIEETGTPLPAFLGSVASTTGASHHVGCIPTETLTAANLCFDLVSAPVDATAFNDTLSRVVRRITECEFPIPAGTPSTGFDVSLRSAAATTRLVQGNANGWRYDDAVAPRSIVVDGTACEALAAKTATAAVSVGCTNP